MSLFGAAESFVSHVAQTVVHDVEAVVDDVASLLGLDSPLAAVSGGFQRAHLEVEEDDPIRFWFNPTTLQRERRANYNSCQAIGEPAPTLEYLGGTSEALSLSVLLHADQDRTSGDVNDTLDALNALLTPSVSVTDTDQLRPPRVRLVWGEYASTESVCESLSTTIELFDAHGRPLRAIVNLQIVQALPDPPSEGQNPTTRATQRRRAHLVHAGDSLAAIAYAHYGDPTRWRAIAEANDIDDPLRLPVGSVLTVPLEAA